MNKILSTISIDDEALNPLRDYFFNNYRGEKFEIILKGEFYIEYKLCDKVQKFYVKQEENLTKISLATDNISNGIILMIHNNQFSYDNENNCYIANTSIWFKREIYNEVLCHEYEKMLTDIFSYIAVFFKYENKSIPCVTKNIVKSKKKNKKIAKFFTIGKEVVDKKNRLSFIDNFHTENFSNYPELKSSIKYVRELETLMKSEEKSFNEAIYIPFNDFKFSFDNNISEVFCHVNEKQKSLECVIIKTGIKLFALSISLEKNPNQEFRIYTFDSFYNLQNEDHFLPITLAQNIVHLMIINFFYFTHYKVITDKVERTSKDIVIKSNTKFRKNTNNANIEGSKNIYLNKVRKIYNISKAIEYNSPKRKKPEYRKFSWQVRGHMRHLSSGKVVYIPPHECSRKKKNENREDLSISSKKYIIKI